MNLFYVNKDPIVAASQLPDKLVVKMVLETAQLLSTAHHVLDGDAVDPDWQLYKPTHVNHPCAVWVRGTSSNYSWTFEHFVGLASEYQLRYGREHFTYKKLGSHLACLPLNIQLPHDGGSFQLPAVCMPDEFKIDGSICASYQNYLANGKEYTQYGEGWFRRSGGRPKWADNWQKYHRCREDLNLVREAAGKQASRLDSLVSKLVEQAGGDL